MKIFIDIETVPGSHKPSLEELEANAPKTMKKPETIRQWAEENLEQEYRKQALDSMQGEILAIGYAFEDGAPVCLVQGEAMPTEAALLASFENELEYWLDAYGMLMPTWIGHNVRSFDLPWLWRKALKYRLYKLAARIPRDRFDRDIEDTMELWAADYKDRVSLAKIAAFLGLESKDMDGSHVFDLWQAGEREKIADYCKQDVTLTRGVYEVLNREG